MPLSWVQPLFHRPWRQTAPTAMADTHSSVAEEQLVTRAQAGDPVAFSSLVRSHQNRIFGFITYLCGSADEATDLTQDVFIKA